MTPSDASLIAAAALLGAAGMPHCAAMCGGLSAAAVRRCAPGSPQGAGASFHAGRLLSYGLAGAVAAAGLTLLQQAAAAMPWTRPFWAMAQAGALALGLWLVWTGRQPAWFSGRNAALSVPVAAGGWQPVRGPVKAAAVGMAWVAWPCGLLQSALVLAALTSSPVTGAVAMGAFAVASAPGLWGARLLLTWGAGAAWAVRVGGTALVVASAWGLGHGVWQRVAAVC